MLHNIAIFAKYAFPQPAKYLMKAHNTHFCILACLLFFTTGCREENSSMPPSLNEEEMYMGCTLSSISPDGDSICMIGSETGDIYRYCTATGKVTDTLETGTDRIYKVLMERTDDGTYCWTGVRNMGLIRYRCTGKGLVMQEQLLMCNGKSRYSSYDFIMYGGRMYVATSHGLMYKDLRNTASNALTLIYPDNNRGIPVPMRTVRLLRHGRFIYAASADGLLKYDTGKGGQPEIMHKGESFSSMMEVNGKIHALAGSVLYIDSPDGGHGSSHDIGGSADIYHFANGIHYFISEDRIRVVRDEDIDRHDRYRTIPLRRKVRTECHNIVMNSAVSPYSLLVTADALFGIPHHLDAFNTDGTATAACSAEGKSYFVTNNSLFVKRDGAEEAVRLADLPKQDCVTDIMMNGNTLYYINGKKELKRKKISGSFIVNGITGAPSVVYSTPLGITSAGISGDGGIYMSVRDSMLLYKDNVIRLACATKMPYTNMFAVRGDSIFAATLNHGVLCGRGTQLRLMDGTERHRFIKDIAFTSFSDSPCILTNHRLFSPCGKDSAEAKGFSRLLTADGKTFYALMEHGIRKYVIGKDGINHIGDTLCDIRFSPSLSFTHAGKVYIGAPSLGIIKMNASGDKAQWIKFNHSVYTFDYKTVIFVLVIIVASAVFYRWHRHRKKKYFETFSEWEEIRKDIGRINPGLVRAMERVRPRDTEAVEKLRDEGLLWLKRYNLLMRKMPPLKELMSLMVLPIIDTSSTLHDTVSRLLSLLEGNDFDLNECEMLYAEALAALHGTDTAKSEKEIWDLYGRGLKFTEQADIGFRERLAESLKEMRNVFGGNMAETVEWLKAFDRKIVFMSVAKGMSETSDKIDALRLNGHIFFNDIMTDAKRAEINGSMADTFAAMSADRKLMEDIGYKPMAHKDGDTQLTGKEKALVLLLIYPKTNWNTVRFIYGINDRSNANNTKIINNLRATFSKVKNKIKEKKGDIEALMTPGSDSISLFFRHMLNVFGEE